MDSNGNGVSRVRRVEKRKAGKRKAGKRKHRTSNRFPLKLEHRLSMYCNCKSLEIRRADFPLTPALSLGEREKLFRRRGLLGGPRLNPALERFMVPMRVRRRSWRLPMNQQTSNTGCRRYTQGCACSRGEKPRASGASQSGAESPHSPADAGLARLRRSWRQDWACSAGRNAAALRQARRLPLQCHCARTQRRAKLSRKAPEQFFGGDGGGADFTDDDAGGVVGDNGGFQR